MLDPDPSCRPLFKEILKNFDQENQINDLWNKLCHKSTQLSQQFSIKNLPVKYFYRHKSF